MVSKLPSRWNRQRAGRAHVLNKCRASAISPEGPCGRPVCKMDTWTCPYHGGHLRGQRSFRVSRLAQFRKLPSCVKTCDEFLLSRRSM